ncbi:MAG: ABC transporter ATP-binding protein [Proteobacteria bacterium]|nr:ABC transporter ATP-binding protein [Pseudomonadota bacterium]
MPELIVERLSKSYGSNAILKGVSLRLAEGKVVALLGHSGSGKTTILRSVAGLETPDDGRIVLGNDVFFDGAAAVDVPPAQRGLGLVFQSYALGPNRTVFANVAYGLRLRNNSDEEIRRRVTEVLERLGLGLLGERFPHQLSGGQQQRVALARALVYQPRVLLLDEPLSNLDAKLREEARSWLRELITQINISALYVTHDQVEAMAVADRILFLRDGQIEQEGSPQDIYERPATAVTADFMGSNNVLAGRIGDGRGDHARLDGEGWRLWGRLCAARKAGEASTGYVRVERTRLVDGPGDNRLPLELATSLYLGERWEHLLTGSGLRIRAWGTTALPRGRHWIEIAADDLWLY